MSEQESSCFDFESVIRGHHIYKSSWTPVIDEELAVCGELGNVYDRHAVCIKKDGNIVGHVPRELARIIRKFLGKGGKAICIVSGHRKRGKGLEVPCTYQFSGKRKLIRRLEVLLKKIPTLI